MYIGPEFCSYTADGSLAVTMSACRRDYPDVSLSPWAAGATLRSLTSDEHAPRLSAACFDMPLISEELPHVEPEHPVARYSTALPAEVRALVVPMRTHQLDVLQACALTPRAVQLGRKDPFLLWLAASCVIQRVAALPLAEAANKAHTLFGLSRLALLRLRLPAADKRAPDLLRKFRGNFDEQDEQALTVLEQGECVHALRHFPLFMAGHCVLWRRQPRLLQLNFIRMETSAYASFSSANIIYLVEDIQAMGRMMQADDIWNRICACRTPEQLYRLHDRLVTLLRKYGAQYFLLDAAPIEPPLEPPAGMEAIRTFQELFDEGTQMHHCVYAYASKVARGNYYVYRMVTPQRATVGIYRRKDGLWDMEQARLLCNEIPMPRTINIIKGWLREAQAHI